MTGPRIRRDPPRRRWLRALLARGFPVAAAAATLFSLLMLVVFFVRIGSDVLYWCREMPQRVATHNAELQANAERARHLERMIAEEMQRLDAEMADEMQSAATPQERADIRADFDKIKVRKRHDLDIQKQEFLQGVAGVRDTSLPALLRHFFTHAPSNQPQDVGILPALLGSILIGFITLACAVPIGVGAAIYLEEYRGASRLNRIIQVNINNLAGVPSVMYGILGAFVFVELIFKPMESSVIAARNVMGGGMTLALLTLPVIIIASQEALRTVPMSLRHGAHALGATRWQVIWHVVLPSAQPGILTGIILALSRALGEAAPLVLFGALLYVDHNPSLFSRFTVLPMQIFGWASRPDAIWVSNAAFASAVLIALVLGLNATAIYLRHRVQRHVKR